MADPIPFTGRTLVDHKPETILEAAKSHPMERVIVIGDLPGGDLWFSGSTGDVASVLLMLERAKMQLLQK